MRPRDLFWGPLGGVDGDGEQEKGELHEGQGEGGVQDQHLLRPPLPLRPAPMFLADWQLLKRESR